MRRASTIATTILAHAAAALGANGAAAAAATAAAAADALAAAARVAAAQARDGSEAAATVAAEEKEKEPDDDESWTAPPFFDYDCDLAPTFSDGAVDWNKVFMWVEESVIRDPKNPNFDIPQELLLVIDEEVGGQTPARAVEECPLGVLYLRTLHFYRVAMGGATQERLQQLGTAVQSILKRFTVYSIALSRWPVFYAMDQFSLDARAEKGLLCDGIEGIVDWGEMRDVAMLWTDAKRTSRPYEEILPMELELADLFRHILLQKESHALAFDECPFGMFFLVASQVVAAANKDTQYLAFFNRLLDDLFKEWVFTTVGASGWPIFTVLHIFADLNKGIWHFGGDRKYLRGFSDWNLRRDELSPLMPQELDFLSPAWRQFAESTVEELVQLPPRAYTESVLRALALKETVEGPVRPILRSLVDAAFSVAALADVSESKGRRRLVYVVLLYGSKWAQILAQFAGRLKQLGASPPLMAISIGPAATAACERLHDEGFKVICWSPDTQSQVHRFTSIHGLLHLGIDIIYMDMDTFMLRDPTPHILQQAEGYDALFASHGDADCINIGVFFLRASARTAIWFSQFVAWYHDHPFEIDQRGLHVFLGLPAARLSIAYPPEDLVRVRAGTFDDLNEVVIGSVGWYGDLSRLLIFHWCQLSIDQKEEEITQAYKAADAAAAHGIPLQVAISGAVQAMKDSPWEKVVRFRYILEFYRKEKKMKRTSCW